MSKKAKRSLVRCSEKSEDQQIADALSASTFEMKKLDSEVLKHRKRLQHLLNTNGLSNVDVPNDGNCFFASIAIQLDGYGVNANQVREAVVTEVTNHVDEYAPFIHNLSDIYKILLSGTWNDDIIDTVPVATANAYNIKLRIFSSNPSGPVLTICPRKVTHTTQTVLLSYLAIGGHGTL